MASSSAYQKTVTISYPAVLALEPGEGSGSSDFDSDFDDVQVCFQAPYPFTTADGSQAPLAQGVYTGLLPDCPVLPTPGPCIDRSASTFTTPDESGNTRFSIVVFIPAGQPGDPRMN